MKIPKSTLDQLFFSTKNTWQTELEEGPIVISMELLTTIQGIMGLDKRFLLRAAKALNASMRLDPLNRTDPRLYIRGPGSTGNHDSTWTRELEREWKMRQESSRLAAAR